MKASVGVSLCFFAVGVQAFVGHAPLLQPRSLWQGSSSPSAAKAAAPEGRRAGRVVVTRMGWGDDVVFSKVRNKHGRVQRQRGQRRGGHGEVEAVNV